MRGVGSWVAVWRIVQWADRRWFGERNESKEAKQGISVGRKVDELCFYTRALTGPAERRTSVSVSWSPAMRSSR